MNRTKLKNYAPQARRDFIQAMTDRAAYFGLTRTKIEPVVEKGDVAVIGGRSHPRAVAKKRKSLEDRIKRHGFEPTMEAMAYTWFNRLVAIRFMERHGYLEHGYRVLSHPEGKPTPEILEHAEHVELPGLKKEAVIDLKLAGNKESELYRLLLTAQCNALHTAMPFLFEKIDDETELLLPDNLLHSDSLIRKLVGEIDEDDWQEVEIIGWLYQFYISEKKDEVIGKVVASEDIPAATQLFTPNWIVKYLVQNTLGRQWLATYPQSALRQQMEYYIEPAEQTPEVQEQLKAITPTSLNPEELTLLDPACGSGHILTEAYDLFKAIYQERGYRAKDIPALILQKNLFGLEIDDRAAQLAAFALMMKARADDRRIFDTEAKPNVVAIQDSQGMNAADLTLALNSPILKEKLPPSEYLIEEFEDAENPLFSKKVMAEKGHVSHGDIGSLLALFENAKTFGSLIQVPPKLAAKLPEIEQRLNEVLKHGDLAHASAQVIKPLIQQAQLLARQYDAVVANPPYMGSSNMPPVLKAFCNSTYEDASGDTFAAFVDRTLPFTLPNGYMGFVTPFVWMFLTTFYKFRSALLDSRQFESLVQLEYNAFEPACVPVCTFVLRASLIIDFKGVFVRLTEFRGAENQSPRLLDAIRTADCKWRYESAASRLKSIPGKPIAYWASPKVLSVFVNSPLLSEVAKPRQGLATGDNNRFLRLWFEVSQDRTFFNCTDQEEGVRSKKRWFPCNKGGPFRKWFGNNQFVVDWENDGRSIRTFVDSKGKLRSRPQNTGFYFRKGITWSTLSSSDASFRLSPVGHIFETKGSTCFVDDDSNFGFVFGFLNSCVVKHLLGMFSPTLDFHEGPISRLPLALNDQCRTKITQIVQEAVAIARNDWNSQETSWEFRQNRLLCADTKAELVADSFLKLSETYTANTERLRYLEQENNSVFLCLYGLDGELSPIVQAHEVVLDCPKPLNEVESLISYAVGCIMGRYSLDTPGLIYARSGNEGFDTRQYKTCRADDDGIMPLLDTDWGLRDDATNRIVDFIGVAWPKEHLEENLRFIADRLGPNNGEQPRDTIRRYLNTEFYKSHLQKFKGPKHPPRPIYWLFSSGKQRAFQCLVYLHRYHEGTLARMRTEYVIPLQGQIAARIEQLEGDKAKATSTSHRNKLQKQQNDLKKQETELRTFEEKLKHAADQKISLDLDDGVKANYAKFGDLLAESKAITGGKDEE